MDRADFTSEPVISIGLPVYNGARFLSRSIDSLLGQSFTNFELIIADNASTDDTAEICERYQKRDARVRYVRHARNIGAPRNWNFVVKQARGRYFKWASANDYCDRKMLAQCAAVLERDPRVVLCYGKTCLVDESDALLEYYSGDFAVTEKRASDRFRRVYCSLRLNNAQNGLIRLDVLKRTGLDRPYPAGDLVLMAELALFGEFHLLPEFLLYRRMGKETATRFLSSASLQEFIDPGATSVSRLVCWRRHVDYVTTIARAPIPMVEKARSWAIAARHAAWDRAALWHEVRQLVIPSRSA